MSSYLSDFNPRSRKGSDLVISKCKSFIRISTHAPARGATGNGLLCAGYVPFQPTLPQGERLGISLEADELTYISTHAPARGATLLYHLRGQPASDFNPRSRKGSDLSSISSAISPVISTHAPARGATAFCTCCNSSALFQPTLPQGERLFKSIAIKKMIEFQPTLPQGERPESLVSYPNTI